MATRRPYDDTKVPVYKTREEIDHLLRVAGATGMAWMEGEHPSYPGKTVIALRFIRPELIDHQKVPVAVRVLIPVPTTIAKRGCVVRMVEKERDQTNRAYHRSLLHYIKAQLDAVDRGLVQFTEAFLPHLELPTGQTVYQTIGPQYLRGAALGDIQPLALLPGN